MSLDNFFLEGDRMRFSLTGASFRHQLHPSTQTQQRLTEAQTQWDAWAARQNEIIDAMPMGELLQGLQAAMQLRHTTLWSEYNNVIQAHLMSIRMYCYAIPAPPLDETEVYVMLQDLDDYISFYMTQGYREFFLPAFQTPNEQEEVNRQQYEASKSLDGVFAQHAILQAKLWKLREAKAMPLLIRHANTTSPLHRWLDNNDMLTQITRAALAEPTIDTRPPPYFRPTQFLS